MDLIYYMRPRSSEKFKLMWNHWTSTFLPRASINCSTVHFHDVFRRAARYAGPRRNWITSNAKIILPDQITTTLVITKLAWITSSLERSIHATYAAVLIEGRTVDGIDDRVFVLWLLKRSTRDEKLRENGEDTNDCSFLVHFVNAVLTN